MSCSVSYVKGVLVSDKLEDSSHCFPAANYLQKPKSDELLQYNAIINHAGSSNVLVDSGVVFFSDSAASVCILQTSHLFLT